MPDDFNRHGESTATQWAVNRQFQPFSLCVHWGWEVRYHIADYAEKIKMVAV
jgi:hypothetical protein